MIIKINLKNSYYTPYIQKYLLKFDVNSVTDIIPGKDSKNETALKQFIETNVKRISIINNEHQSDEECSWLEERIRKSLYSYLLSMPDLDEEDARLTVKMMDISFPKFFSRQRRGRLLLLVFAQQDLLWCSRKNMKKIRICACNIA